MVVNSVNLLFVLLTFFLFFVYFFSWLFTHTHTHTHTLQIQVFIWCAIFWQNCIWQTTNGQMVILHKNKGNLLQNIFFDQVISAVIFIVRVLPLRALGEWGPPKITISLTLLVPFLTRLVSSILPIIASCFIFLPLFDTKHLTCTCI